MTNRTTDPSITTAPKEHAPARLVPGVDGGFRLTGPGRTPRDFRPEGDGYRSEEWILRGTEDGHVLATNGEVRGETLSPPGSRLPIVVQLRDGRMFRVVPGPPPDFGFDLVGWEVSGVYVEARLSAGGEWSLTTQPAGGGLEDWTVPLTLMAAEIVAAGKPGEPGKR